MSVRALLFLVVSTCGLMACAPESRMGMVVDQRTGTQMGSVVGRNLVLAATQLENRKVRVAIRNTSGDPAFDLGEFRGQIERALASKGYQPTPDDDFGLLYDVNVRYSGQATRDRATEFGLLGGATGGVVGYNNTGGGGVGTITGVLAGATLGSILGSYVRDETYLVVADVVVAVVDPVRGETDKTIVFDSTRRRIENQRRTGIKPFTQQMSSGVAVYAGGRNASQQQVAGGVRERFARILSDII